MLALLPRLLSSQMVRVRIGIGDVSIVRPSKCHTIVDTESESFVLVLGTLASLK